MRGECRLSEIKLHYTRHFGEGKRKLNFRFHDETLFRIRV